MVGWEEVEAQCKTLDDVDHGDGNGVFLSSTSALPPFMVRVRCFSGAPPIPSNLLNARSCTEPARIDLLLPDRTLVAGLSVVFITQPRNRLLSFPIIAGQTRLSLSVRSSHAPSFVGEWRPPRLHMFRRPSVLVSRHCPPNNEHVKIELGVSY